MNIFTHINLFYCFAIRKSRATHGRGIKCLFMKWACQAYLNPSTSGLGTWSGPTKLISTDGVVDFLTAHKRLLFLLFFIHYCNMIYTMLILLNSSFIFTVTEPFISWLEVYNCTPHIVENKEGWSKCIPLFASYVQ